jgi:hypothetical protein
MIAWARLRGRVPNPGSGLRISNNAVAAALLVPEWLLVRAGGPCRSAFAVVVASAAALMEPFTVQCPYATGEFQHRRRHRARASGRGRHLHARCQGLEQQVGCTKPSSHIPHGRPGDGGAARRFEARRPGRDAFHHFVSTPTRVCRSRRVPVFVDIRAGTLNPTRERSGGHHLQTRAIVGPLCRRRMRDG